MVAHTGGLKALSASVSFVLRMFLLLRSFGAVREARRVGVKAGVVGLSHDRRWIGTDCGHVVLTTEYHNIGVNHNLCGSCE